ncbi:Small-conductance mechanosensitive channel [Tsuneonella dongtanensis]|uniref:Small-conductance mechanosensitive channel n=1 Tax=Tsuneonella dongtanensis TaxID=692370 RepID=A0A1B2A9C9_9SPHN|nr:mechanosensitive ion channel family protein [Tsuneonella dongtanensis]ANY18742.1 Small-conductance mechanosensitive channel [Tsuneonella dongtanensis]
MTRLIVALLLSLVAISPASALSPVTPTPDVPAATAASPAISTVAEDGSDERIGRRLQGIFGELPAFADVEVAVNEGVVTLTGTVPADDDIDRAEGIAGRVAGVVTVENRLERDVSIDGGAAVGGLAERVAEFTRLLPLLGLALAVWLGISLLGYLIAGIGALWQRLAPNSFLAELIASAIRFVFVVGGLVVALDIVGATALLGAVLGGAGLAGIALGFAMRDTIENYVASLMLSLRQPFRANDHVVIDGSEGRVIRLTSRATVLMTLDGNHLRIPNANVFKATILNYTRNPKRRFDFLLGIDADDDPEVARCVGRDALAALPFVLAEPPPEARTEEVGDSNIVLKFLGWIDQQDSDWFKAKSGAIAAVKSALEDAGFALPEPIYRLRFDARTTPLPFEQVEHGEVRSAGKPKKKPDSKAVSPEPEDVRPNREIAEMVADERRTAPAEQERDLLDEGRPVE